MGSLLSSSSATVVMIDGTGYDYSQLGTLKFACSINSKHYLNFSQYIYCIGTNGRSHNNYFYYARCSIYNGYIYCVGTENGDTIAAQNIELDALLFCNSIKIRRAWREFHKPRSFS